MTALLSIVLIILLLVSCGRNRYIGDYGGLLDDGLIGKWIFVKLTLNKDGTAETTIFGREQFCYYEIEDTTLTLTFVGEWGYGFSLKGSIDGNEIVFPNVTLEKGRTYVDFEEVLDSLNGST